VNPILVVIQVSFIVTMFDLKRVKKLVGQTGRSGGELSEAGWEFPHHL